MPLLVLRAALLVTVLSLCGFGLVARQRFQASARAQHTGVPAVIPSHPAPRGWNDALASSLGRPIQHRAARPHHVVRPIPVKRARNTGRLPNHPSVVPHNVGNPFGVGAFVVQRGHPEEARLIRRSRALGAGWVREEITASAVHNSVDGGYHWGVYDRVINAEIAAGIHVLGLLDYSNSWGYASHAVMPPADIAGTSADFATFAAAAAHHFRGRIRYWQVWNEPDLSVYWQPKPSAGDYATLLSAAYHAIKAVSPSDRVVLAGTSGVDLSFIRAVARRTSDFDVLAVHPYREQPETDLLRQIQALHAFHRPIWFTEIGWPGADACQVCSTEGQQAADLVRLYALAVAAGVQRVFWYDLRDDARGVSPTETHYGLLFRNLSGKPSASAYAFLAHELQGSRFVGADAMDVAGAYALRFIRGGQTLEIVWNVTSHTKPVSLVWPSASAARVDVFGTPLGDAPVTNGVATIEAPGGGQPVYLMPADPPYHVPILRGIVLPVSVPAHPAVHSRPHPRQAHRRTPASHRRPRVARRHRSIDRAAHRAAPAVRRPRSVPATPSRSDVQVAPTRTPRRVHTPTPEPVWTAESTPITTDTPAPTTTPTATTTPTPFPAATASPTPAQTPEPTGTPTLAAPNIALPSPTESPNAATP